MEKRIDIYCKENHITGHKQKCNEYRQKLEIMNKIIEEKYDAYEAKCILGYKNEKLNQQLQRTKREKKPGMDKIRENTYRIKMGSGAIAKTSRHKKKQRKQNHLPRDRKEGEKRPRII